MSESANPNEVGEGRAARVVTDAHETTIVGSGVRARRARDTLGTHEARRLFGGIDIPASLAGMVSAVGLAVLLAGLATGVGSVGYQLGVDDTTRLSAGGLIAGLVVLLLAFLFGGWVAGRMARYDGGRNGLLSAIWFLVLAAGLSVLGTWLGDKYNFLANVNLPNWFSRDAFTGRALLTGLIALLVMLIAAWLGGILGARYHRQVDKVVAQTAHGGVARPDELRYESDTRHVIRREG